MQPRQNDGAVFFLFFLPVSANFSIFAVEIGIKHADRE